jgi:hypothetical protein
MKNRKYLSVYLWLLPILFTSCVGAYNMSVDMNKYETSLKYLYDTPANSRKKNVTVKINPIIMKASFPDSAEVKKKKIVFIPALIFYYWKADYECMIGRKNIIENPENFIKESFITEANRSGSFIASKDSGDYTLELAVNGMESKGPYREHGYLFFLVYARYSNHYSAGPGVSNMTVSYKLKRGDQLIKEGVIEKSSMTPMPYSRSAKVLRKNYTINMTEALSKGIKAVIENIVKEISSGI